MQKMGIWCTKGDIRCFSKRMRTGRSTYGCVRRGGQLTKEGPFLYTGFFRDSVGVGGSFYVKGQFHEGKKTGRWVFKTHKNKKTKTLVVHYLDGRQEGAYEMKSVNRRFGILPLRVSLHMQMKGGKPCGPLRAKSNVGRCRGSFDTEGRPDGTWLLMTKTQLDAKLKVNEVWEHGVLKSGEETQRGKTRTFDSRTQIVDKIYPILRSAMSMEKVCDMGSSVVALYVPDGQ